MQSIITVVGQSELGATELIPVILVLVSLAIAVVFFALLVFSIKQKSHQLAALNCCLCIGVGIFLQPWVAFYQPTPESPVTFWTKVQLVGWGLALVASVAAFFFTISFRKKERPRGRKRRRSSRSAKG